MSHRPPTKEELKRAHSEVDLQWPAIISANERLAKILGELPPMAQKQVLCMFAATWVRAFCADDDKDGLTLAAALFDQIKVYLAAKDDSIK